MSNPIHRHDCNDCRFINSVDGIDVYVCGDVTRPYGSSIVARFSDEPSDNASSPLTCFLDSVKDNGRIGLSGGNSMPFRDYLNSPHVIDYHKAWMISIPMI